MSEKITIADKLKKRKYKQPNKFLWDLYGLIGGSYPLLGKYGVTYNVVDDINKCKGPCFLLWNHQSRRDHLLLKKIVAPKRYNMVASYPEFFRGKFKTVFKISGIIPKKMFTNDPTSIKAMNSIIKQGGCVCFSPEGTSSIFGDNQPIVPGTGRFLKFYRIPVYFVKFEGAYLTSHKVDIEDRLGKIVLTEYLMFSPEDLAKLTPQEIEDKINLACKQDDYEWNKIQNVEYKTKKSISSHMNDMAYKCPKCGKEFSMKAEHDDLYCESCGNGVHIDHKYNFSPLHKDDVFPESPLKWVKWERQEIIKEIRENPNYSFEADVDVGELPKYEYIKDPNACSVPCGKGKIKIDHNGIHFEGSKNGESWKFDLSYEVYYSLVIEVDLTLFGLYVNEEYYEFKPSIPCVGKILLLVEEMHRLHVNTWKNFSWNDYMYEGIESNDSKKDEK